MSNEVKRKEAKQRLTAYIKAAQARCNKKTVNLRRIAEEEPHEVGNALSELSQVFGDISEIFKGLSEDASGLQDNLDLSEPGKTASIAARVAARRNYAKTLRRIANEEPEQLGAALSEVYRELDEVVGNIETLAENFGLPLELEAAPEPTAEAAPVEAVEALGAVE